MFVLRLYSSTMQQHAMRCKASRIDSILQTRTRVGILAATFDRPLSLVSKQGRTPILPLPSPAPHKSNVQEHASIPLIYHKHTSPLGEGGPRKKIKTRKGKNVIQHSRPLTCGSVCVPLPHTKGTPP